MLRNSELDKEAGRVGYRRPSKPQNTEKSPGNLWRLWVTQTPNANEENSEEVKAMWKPRK